MGSGWPPVERIVRLHGGHIDGEARLGEGARFSFLLSEPPSEFADESPPGSAR
jgi:hypothetical protein